MEEIKGPAAGRGDGVFKERGTTDADSTPTVLQKGREKGSNATHTRHTVRREMPQAEVQGPAAPRAPAATKQRHVERTRP